MTQMLTGETADADTAELELAEAQAAAAEAEAAAARARAEVAKARVKAARGRKRVESEPGQEVAEPISPAEDHAAIAAPATTPGEDPVGEDVVGEDAPDGDAIEDDSAAEQAESDTAAEPAESGRPGRLRTLGRKLLRPSKVGVALAVMVMVTLAAVAGAVAIGWQHHQAGEQQDRAARFSDVAELGVVAVTSLDYRNAERDVKRIVDLSTGEFAKDFTDRSKDFTSVIKKSEVTTKGKVTSSAVESVDGDTATVLVAATSEVTNAAGAKEEPRTWRLRVTVTDVDGTMKISKVDFVP